MIAFDEAIRLMVQAVSPLGTEVVALGDASGRVLAEPLFARCDAPRHAVSSMDGYAVAHADARTGAVLRVVGESRPGGRFPGTVCSGEAVRIFTGAPMPAGSDRCIIQEDVERDGDVIRVAGPRGPQVFVRNAGSDFAAGDLLLRPGTRLTARSMIAAAAADVCSMKVGLRPRVAVIGTGDELAEPGTAHQHDHAIPDSVTYGVAAMARSAGASMVSRSTVPDDLSSLTVRAAEALAEADLVIVTGGASVGERDFAKPMFAAHGLDLVFSKVAIKPGKPVWFGRSRGAWVLGLPGNPTSAMVTARLFMVPVLASLQGQSANEVLRWRTMRMAAPLPDTGDRETFFRASWDSLGLTPLPDQDSGSQLALAEADWLIRCPAGQVGLAADQLVSALHF
jgi:molybdopterin molybdotransferase